MLLTHEFFHWPLEFPDVFGGAENAGFGATVGNPPWDVMEPKTQEFYTDYDLGFRSLEGEKATKRIRELHAQHPALKAVALLVSSLTTVTWIIPHLGE